MHLTDEDFEWFAYDLRRATEITRMRNDDLDRRWITLQMPEGYRIVWSEELYFAFCRRIANAG